MSQSEKENHIANLSGFLLYLRHGQDYAQGDPIAKGIGLYLKGFLRFFLLLLQVFDLQPSPKIRRILRRDPFANECEQTIP